MSKNAAVKLRYFNFWGKAESIRLFFEDFQIPYVEERIERDQWSDKKPEYYKSGICPFGQLPVVSDGSKHLAQSRAILRYYAKKYDGYGDTPEQQYLCDQAAEGLFDYRPKFVQLLNEPEDKFEEKKKAYVETEIPIFVDAFEGLLRNNPEAGPYFARPNKITFADICVFDFLICLIRLDGNCLDKHNTPLLKDFYQRMASRPNIIKYINSGRRPERVNKSKNG
ncbi:glutathione S-transferase P [Acrasis kona]|uniref:Glutathione S-transferase P n=1 Tax=Acrasis kona TaxID=1008807 RepID=A0AAW2ZL60_9EUKA